eukprot:scaffold347570_cov32-Prasinocladus_malaysianus.AAC.1
MQAGQGRAGKEGEIGEARADETDSFSDSNRHFPVIFVLFKQTDECHQYLKGQGEQQRKVNGDSQAASGINSIATANAQNADA